MEPLLKTLLNGGGIPSAHVLNQVYANVLINRFWCLKAMSPAPGRHFRVMQRALSSIEEGKRPLPSHEVY